MTLLESPPQTPLRESCSPVLETERLILRAPRSGDAKAIAALANDRRIAENLLRLPHPYGVEDAREFLAAANARESEASFALTLRSGELIGICGIHFNGEPAPELGYWLGTAHWDQGYATEAARAVIDYAFDDLGYDALLAGARVANPASRRVLEKCGFQWTVGLYRIRALASSAPVDRFRLDRRLWASLRNWRGMHRVA
ncbi:MAG TPA: GNAT family N-acetyltransferase [Xanthobacteraceae bacterium]|nr:GNAT family N-acetyltransferase [Xanthobacteraceae bacterium]